MSGQDESPEFSNPVGRTARRFFNDDAVEAEFLQRIGATIERAGLWQEFDTDWLCLDCELMPWSAKAQELLRSQYAAVGAAARAAILLWLTRSP